MTTLESHNPFGSGNESALSFSNKRPISIAIGISRTVTRYARLMDPRSSLLSRPFHEPLSPFLSYLDGMAPMLWAHPYIKGLYLSPSFVVLAHDLQILPSICSRLVSLFLFDLIKENTRNLGRDAHTRASSRICLFRGTLDYHRWLSHDAVWILKRRVVYVHVRGKVILTMCYWPLVCLMRAATFNERNKRLDFSGWMLELT